MCIKDMVKLLSGYFMRIFAFKVASMRLLLLLKLLFHCESCSAQKRTHTLTRVRYTFFINQDLGFYLLH